MRTPLIGAGLLASLGTAILLIALFAGKTSPRGHIDGNYRKVAAGTYASPKTPLRVAGEIVGKHPTKERVYTPNGVYLRYHDAVVGIVPVAGGGSRITVDTPERGYARYHSAVGGDWGGPGGRAAFFRGGGPGGGGK
ncbi:uncharacterized protein DUF4247 [Actinomadura hallensis]|uniref:Uncharacterized protein DUF4247 n=1 Tax=Actinomadura hallensis TaxID=337895 RepID=A0A543IAZ3_9ACTN|nr:DUF4247 domain-containing protein [Actinomadura hallensis]TQM67710.1 uncharacterized protein DUF4247 [Actinomadura hallensis]HLV73911.1 DUF4247 domain-containing protein [Vulgatibacteraceae bacterium]